MKAPSPFIKRIYNWIVVMYKDENIKLALTASCTEAEAIENVLKEFYPNKDYQPSKVEAHVIPIPDGRTIHLGDLRLIQKEGYETYLA